MAEDNPLKQYNYREMANKVITADRSTRQSRRENEPTGEPESLAGKINLHEMGSRIPQQKDRIETPAKGQPTEIRGTRKRKRDLQGQSTARGYSNILEAAEQMEGLVYYPKTQETRLVYEQILGFVRSLLGADYAEETVISATDLAIEVLKDENLVKDFDRKNKIQDAIGESLSSDSFNKLSALSRKITDFKAEDDGEEEEEERARRDEEEQFGVSMAIDEEDEEDENPMDFDDEESDDASSVLSDHVDIATGEDIQEKVEEEEADVAVIGEDDMAAQQSSKKRGREEADKVYAHEIDSFWLQRTIAVHYSDPHTAQEKATAAFSSLVKKAEHLGAIENELVEIFDFENFDIVKLLVKNRDAIVWCTKLARAQDEKAKSAVRSEIEELGLGWILSELYGERENKEKRNVTSAIDRDRPELQSELPGKEKEPSPMRGELVKTKTPKRLVELESLVFNQGGRLMTNKKVSLPQGSTKTQKKGYEEIQVPAPKVASLNPGEKKVPVTKLPEWAQPAFAVAGIKELNRIQSRLFPVAFGQDDNILLCAPTGAGKTNVAMLCILNEIQKYRNTDTGHFALDQFKIVYVAPLKALVAEQTGQFRARLEQYGIKVEELTGDRQMTKQQISETQIIVTTPEKWDVITRKATDASYTNLVRLMIIDEIHLLHDERGPVLESLVSRTIRKMEQTNDLVRLVGLSATLPNYKDVANFLRVDEKKGLFYFDSTYRPCPLRQEFVGVTEKKAIKRLQIMNDVAYEKVMDQAGKNQLLIFVHSRKETAKTAKYIRDKAVEEETIGQLLRTEASHREILRVEAERVGDPNLKDLLPYGFAIHHAGMTRADRSSVEDLFNGKFIQVLVSTATLAWGVNLPAHTVIIKGTQIYSPEKGRWVELSPQDVLQMLGRAGRPQFDTYGEGIIITQYSELQYYLSLLNQQLPIESQFVSKLADNLNAEIVLGTVRNRDEAVDWLGYTYLYVRMLRSPALYQVGADYEDDGTLEQKRVDLIHSAATVLHKCKLIKYDPVTGVFSPQEIGKIASHYYITHTSMDTYNKHFNENVSDIDLFRIFALSEEFKYIPVRSDEKVELARIKDRVPIPVKETIDEPTAKINVLLQSYISRFKLDGFAIVSDMVYITQSAGRILRAIFEICLKGGWANVAKLALDMCKMVEKRMWLTNTPLRQIPSCPKLVIQRAERSNLLWSRYFDLDPPELGEALHLESQARLVHRLVHQFPRLELQASVQPITPSLLRVDLTITPDFKWEDSLHGLGEQFWIMVEDVDGEKILYYDQFLLRKQYINEDHTVEFTVPMQQPMPPNYFVTVVSDRWLHSETKLALPFKNLILPEKYPPHTQLLDRQPLPVAALRSPEYIAVYSSWLQQFNKIQTQVFQTLYSTDDNVFIGAPTGSGKTICAEFALLRHWSKDNHGRAVYIAPFQEMLDFRLKNWQERFGNIDGGKRIVALSGEISTDLKLLEQGDVIFATPVQWDQISRRWKQRKNVQTIELFIADEIHLIGSSIGPTYEVIVSRMRYMAAQLETQIRIVALSTSLANAKDLGEWIGCTKHAVYNFSTGSRPNPLVVQFQAFNIPHQPSLMIAMTKPTYLAVTQQSPDKPSMIFVPNRKQCRATAEDLLMYAAATDEENRFLVASPDDMAVHLERLEDKKLGEFLSHGVGYWHEALSLSDKRIVQRLYEAGAFLVLLVSKEVCWSIPLTAHLVVVMGTQYFDGSQHRYRDYLLSDVLQILGRACRPTEDAKSRAVIMTPEIKRDYYRKFITEALPIESYLQFWLHDAFVTEVTTKTIENKQDAVDWLTWTFFYRRLVKNPSFYGLQDISHSSLSDFLSDLVESTLQELTEAKVLAIEDEMDILPLNTAMIAAYYNITWSTLQTFTLSLTSKTKLKGLLEIVTSAAEYEDIPIRRHEDVVLQRIYDRVPVKLGKAAFESPHFKAFVLLQAHFSRLQLPPDLATDQQIVLGKILNLLSACVDVMSSEGWLNAFGAMELSQMSVQGVWDRDSPLKQIPCFTSEIIKKCKDVGVESVFDIIEMEDDQRNELLQMSQSQLAAVAGFVNKYPNIDINFELEDPETIVSGSPAFLKVELERDIDEEEKVDNTVHAPYFPGKKSENCNAPSLNLKKKLIQFSIGWLVISSASELLSIKKVQLGRKLDIRMDFTISTAGRQSLKLFCFSDSYAGVDQEHEFEIVAAEGAGEDTEAMSVDSE